MFSIQLEIEEVTPTWELEKYAFSGFLKHSVEFFGYDGDVNSFALVIKNEEDIVGVLVAKTFYGGLHIRQLYLEKELRGQGYGTALMEKALRKGKEMGCSFTYLETLNFQALGFYQKLGFQLEFTREGYNHEVSMHYLRKAL